NKKSVRAAQLEEEGDLNAAERQWNEAIRDPDKDKGNDWTTIGLRRVAEQYPVVQDLRANLAKRHFSRMEDFPDDELTIADESERRAFTALRFEEVVGLVEARQRWRELRDDLQKKPDLHTWFLLAASKVRDLDLE